MEWDGPVQCVILGTGEAHEAAGIHQPAWQCSGLAACGTRATGRQAAEYRGTGANATVWAPWMAAFVAHLRELGWVEGHTIAIEYRWTEGSAARVSEIGADFLRQNVSVIVTYGGAVAVLKQATTVTPIVFAVAVDPVRGGLVASFGAAGRQRYRNVDPTVRSCQQAARTLARGYPPVPPNRDHVRCELFQFPAGGQRRQGHGSHARPRFRVARNPAARGHSANLRGAQSQSGRTLRRVRCAHSR